MPPCAQFSSLALAPGNAQGLFTGSGDLADPERRADAPLQGLCPQARGDPRGRLRLDGVVVRAAERLSRNCWAVGG